MSWRRSLFVAFALASACHQQHADTPPPTELLAWFRPEIALADPALMKTAELIGSWNNWARPGITGFATETDSSGTLWARAGTTLAPGVYTYAIVVGDQLILDENNPQTEFVTDPLGRTSAPFSTEVSRAVIATPTLSITSRATDANSLTVIAKGSVKFSAQLWQGNTQLAAPSVSQNGDSVQVRAENLSAGKYTVRFVDPTSNAILTAASGFIEPARVGLPERQQDDGMIYEIMVDRFRGDDGNALPALQTPGSRAGGTLLGVQKMIESGYFTQLGVTTLWLTPVYQNPEGWFVDTDGRLYESYHGYWPSEPRTVEDRFGGEAALDAMVGAAHKVGLRVILDVVPHHTHDQHPYWLNDSAAGLTAAGGDPTQTWFTDDPGAGSCICGGSCESGAQVFDCWFNPFLPSLNWQNPAVDDAQVGDLQFWMQRFDVDGVRIDAVPLMPRMASRRIERGLYEPVMRGAPGSLDFLVLGENYVGIGDPGLEILRAYLGRALDGLDSEFDFPLMWELRDVIAHGQGNIVDLETAYAHANAFFAGSGAAMSHMLDNQDVTRFVSEAANDADGDPWYDAPPQPTVAEPYQLQWLGLVYTLTLDGIPVLYYGDEIGLAGATDPDSRRLMPADADLNALQLALRENTQTLGQARACSSTLRHGARTTRYANADVMVIELSDATGAALLVFSRSQAAQTIPLSGVSAPAYEDIISHAKLSAPGGNVALTVPPLSAMVYLSTPSSCVL